MLEELETNFDKWLYVIKNLNGLDEIPEQLQEEAFQKVFDVAEYAAMTKEERQAYENSMKYYRDLHNVVVTAEEDGIKKGIKKAEKKLLPIIEQNKQELEQKDQALEQNKQELEQNKQALINSAKAMLESGMSIEQVHVITKLPVDLLNKR